MHNNDLNDKTFERKYRTIILCAFFALYLIVGIFVFRDYGLSWDEPRSRQNGEVALNYILGKDQTLLTYDDRYYGSAFEIFLVAVERALHVGHPRSIYLMRHLLTFLLFYFSVIFFYFICRDRFRNRKIALLGCLFLILSPRIFADSFYNSKDIAFLSFFIISMYTLIGLLRRKSVPWAFVHGVASAILVDIRIIGIIMPFLTFLFLVGDMLLGGNPKNTFKVFTKNFSLYIFTLVPFIVIFWPTLWENPISNFTDAFNQMSHFEKYDTQLYFGNYIPAPEVPWHYSPVWIAITTPIAYLLLFLVGAVSLVKQLLSNPIRFYSNNKEDLIFVLWFFFPLFMVIVTKATLYDGWRHMYFIYPAFVIIVMKGLVKCFSYVQSAFCGVRRKVISALIIMGVVVSVVQTANFMITNHPYQNIYFNILAGNDMEKIKSRFDLDYWGVSYGKALEHVLRNDPSQKIKIYVANPPGWINSFILPTEERKRLAYVKDPQEAKYFISNYRWHKEEYPYKDEHYSIKVGGAKIVVVYKIN